MTHSAGVPLATGPRPDLKRMDDSDYARDMLGKLKPIYRPGLVHMYHGLTWGPLVREIVSAATGRNIREILGDRDPRPARLPVDQLRRGRAGRAAGRAEPRDGQAATGRHGRGVQEGRRRDADADHPVLEHADVPHQRGAVVEHRLDRRRAVPIRRDTASRRRTRRCAGAVPDTLRAATRQARRLRPDVATGLMPMRWGTGYMLGSSGSGRSAGTRPTAFGHTGLVDIAVWADPSRRLSAAVVSSGKPGGHPEAKRYPALLDAITAALPQTHLDASTPLQHVVAVVGVVVPAAGRRGCRRRRGWSGR